MMHALNELCIIATKGTQPITRALTNFLNYCASNPDAEIIHRNSDMILTVNSDTAYLVSEKSRSRAAVYFYLGNKDGKNFIKPISIVAKVIKAVMVSAAETECGGLYMNTQ